MKASEGRPWGGCRPFSFIPVGGVAFLTIQGLPGGIRAWASRLVLIAERELEFARDPPPKLAELLETDLSEERTNSARRKQRPRSQS
jgi:hypothetical protein